MNPVPALRIAGDALAVFLTYPEATHPLAHRLRSRWLRPPAVRVGLAAVVLAAVATSAVKPPESKKAEKPATTEQAAPALPPVPPPAAPWPRNPRTTLPEDEFAGRGFGAQGPGGWNRPEFGGFGGAPFNPPSPAWNPAPVPPADLTPARPSGDAVRRLAASPS